MTHYTGTGPRYKLHKDLIEDCHTFVMQAGRFDLYLVRPGSTADWPPLMRACTRYGRSLILRNYNGRIAVMNDDDRHYEGGTSPQELSALLMAAQMLLPSQGALGAFNDESDLEDWLDDLIWETQND